MAISGVPKNVSLPGLEDMDDLRSPVRPFLRIDVSGSNSRGRGFLEGPQQPATGRYSEDEVADDMVGMPTHTCGFRGFSRNASAPRNRAGPGHWAEQGCGRASLPRSACAPTAQRSCGSSSHRQATGRVGPKGGLRIPLTTTER